MARTLNFGLDLILYFRFLCFSWLHQTMKIIPTFGPSNGSKVVLCTDVRTAYYFQSPGQLRNNFRPLFISCEKILIFFFFQEARTYFSAEFKAMLPLWTAVEFLTLKGLRLLRACNFRGDKDWIPIAFYWDKNMQKLFRYNLTAWSYCIIYSSLNYSLFANAVGSLATIRLSPFLISIFNFCN